MLLKKGLKLHDINQVGLSLFEYSSIDDFLLKHPSLTINTPFKSARRDLLETRIENQIRETTFPRISNLTIKSDAMLYQDIVARVEGMCIVKVLR
jgi:hypothetical protein